MEAKGPRENSVLDGRGRRGNEGTSKWNQRTRQKRERMRPGRRREEESGRGGESGELEEEAMKRPRDKKKEGEEWRETKRQS